MVLLLITPALQFRQWSCVVVGVKLGFYKLDDSRVLEVRLSNLSACWSEGGGQDVCLFALTKWIQDENRRIDCLPCCNRRSYFDVFFFRLDGICKELDWAMAARHGRET